MRGRPRIDPAHSRQAEAKSKFVTGHFVAWDGEGACAVPGCVPDPNGEPCPHPQEYVYLANSEGGELIRPDGIRSLEAFEFFTTEAARLGPTATHVCFGLSYDANMVLRDVGRATLRRIWESKSAGGRVRVFHRFKVAYRPRKMLWVKDCRTGSSVTIWDVFGFFQMSFVKALVKHLGRNDPRLPLIIQGKARRSQFRPDELPSIIPYTQAELSALVDLCKHLREAFIGAGLRLRRWDGAGAAGAALLEREGVKRALAPSPPEVALAARYAFVGGRIETLRYGFFKGRVHHADKRSAYPAAAVDMPRLSEGHWLHSGASLPPDPFAVVKVRWDYGRLGDKWACLPFAFRTSRSAIYFPRRGVTWAWRPEVDAALRFPELARRTEVLDSWAFRPSDPSDRPFDFIPRLYAERQRLIELGDPAEKALKLALNSSYGKLAQTVGGTKDRHPPFHQLEYAGWITSVTRADMWERAVATGPGSVAIATDGLFATDPIPGLRVSKALGAWDYSEHDAMLIAQSGVYWTWDPTPEECPKCHGPMKDARFDSSVCADAACGWSTLTHHYRGFDEDTLNPEAILSAWGARRSVVSTTTHRFITLGRATVATKSFANWRRWVKEPRELSIHADGKRLDRVPPSAWRGRSSPALGFLPTDPADPFEAESFPYTLKWAREEGAAAATAQEQVSL